MTFGVLFVGRFWDGGRIKNMSKMIYTGERGSPWKGIDTEVVWVLLCISIEMMREAAFFCSKFEGPVRREAATKQRMSE